MMRGHPPVQADWPAAGPPPIGQEGPYHYAPGLCCERGAEQRGTGTCSGGHGHEASLARISTASLLKVGSSIETTAVGGMLNREELRCFKSEQTLFAMPSLDICIKASYLKLKPNIVKVRLMRRNA